MKPIYPEIVKSLRKQLEKYGYTLSFWPSTRIVRDLSATVEKIVGEKVLNIFSTRDRKELLQGINLILKLEKLSEGIK
ncbi:MAG: hypothetical protein ACE5J2_02315 [Nitrososphaerales archaeon]